MRSSGAKIRAEPQRNGKAAAAAASAYGRQRSHFEHLLESSCNFSLGCEERAGSAGARNEARNLLELRAANATSGLLAAHRPALAWGAGPKQQSGLFQLSQAEAAGAMVGMVRLTLVILICVLLAKLHAIPGAQRSARAAAAGRTRRGRARRTAGGPHEPMEEEEEEEEVVVEEKQEAERADKESHLRATTKISAEEQQTQSKVAANVRGEAESEEEGGRAAPSSIDCKSKTTNLERLLGGLSLAYAPTLVGGAERRAPPRRRLSQPALMATGRAQAQAPSSGAASGWQHKANNAAERRRRHSDTNAIVSNLQLPPGPTGLPFLGYLPFLGTEIHLTLTELSQRFGPIYQIFLGGIRVVVLNDASLVRQAFKQSVFSGRPDTQLTRILQGYGIVNSDGALWKEQRAFLHSALRKLGAKSLMSGSSGLEAKIQVSADR